MPAELLRDIFRSRDDSRRTRRLSMLPLSIAAHAAAALAIVIIPIAAESELPMPAPLPGPAFVKAQPLPPPPAAIPNNATRVASPAAAPVVAPETITPERPVEIVPPTQPGVPVEGGLPSGGNGVIGGVSAMIESPPLPPPPPLVPSLVKVGGLVREPKRIVNVAPVYPVIALNNRVEGLVMLEAVINESGAVERIKVRKSVPLLDAAAIEAVRQWRYTPTLLNGSPVSVLMTISVRFTLN